ncbi:MAG: O-methyltransferase [Myxococcota bacterium]
MSSKTLNMPEGMHSWLLSNIVKEAPSLRALRERTFAEVGMARMQISPEQGAFMGWLTKTIGVKRAIEVGTFTGYSALAVALAMPDDGHMVCCDVSEEWTQLAREAWDAAGVASKISLRIAPALQTLDALIADGQVGTFDLAFIDADKENYGAYVDRCLDLLRPGGVIGIDNALWGGRVADPAETDDSTQAIRASVLALANDPRVTASMVPIGDGLLLATKK